MDFWGINLCNLSSFSLFSKCKQSNNFVYKFNMFLNPLLKDQGFRQFYFRFRLSNILGLLVTKS